MQWEVKDYQVRMGTLSGKRINASGAESPILSDSMLRMKQEKLPF